MSADGPVGGESFAALWKDLDRLRCAGRWTRARLARRISKLSQQPCSEKTLHDRMSRGRRVAWEEMRWAVLALELDEQSWKQRWQLADNVWHKDRTSQQSGAESSTTGPVGQHDANIVPELPSTRRLLPGLRWHRRLQFAGVGVAAALLIIALAYFMNRPEQDRAPLVACARVITPTADVFLSPGDHLPIVTKKRNAWITLPVDTPVIMSADRQRYHVVRTPRTSSGRAYMREDTLSLVSC